MCIVCVSYSKEAMTYTEAYKALRESSLDPVFLAEHLEDAIDFIDQTEIERQQRERHNPDNS